MSLDARSSRVGPGFVSSGVLRGSQARGECSASHRAQWCLICSEAERCLARIRADAVDYYSRAPIDRLALRLEPVSGCARSQLDESRRTAAADRCPCSSAFAVRVASLVRREQDLLFVIGLGHSVEQLTIGSAPHGMSRGAGDPRVDAYMSRATQFVLTYPSDDEMTGLPKP